MLRLSRALQAAAAQPAVWPWAAVLIFPLEQVMAAEQVVPVLVLLQRPPAESQLARLCPASERRLRQAAALGLPPRPEVAV
jgi:hypothetical protein